MSDTRIGAALGQQVYVDGPEDHALASRTNIPCVVVTWHHDGTVSVSLLCESKVVARNLEMGGFHEFHAELLADEGGEYA